jgi:sec-independent protein translocase protein TatA
MDLLAPTHLLLLLVVVLVIFGPSRLGDVGGALGKGIRDFKRAVNEPETSQAAATVAQPQLDSAIRDRHAVDGRTLSAEAKSQ